jgi:hypothetical protein
MDNFLRVVGKNLERKGVSNVFGESHESSPNLRGLVTSDLMILSVLVACYVHNTSE